MNNDVHMLKGQLERMEQRIEAATRRWADERRKLEIEIKAWRDKLADMSERLFAAEAVKMRQAARIARLRECLEWLNRRVGLDRDVHERIKKTLDEKTERGTGVKRAIDHADQSRRNM